MAVRVQVRITVNLGPQLSARARAGAGVVVRATAARIEADAKSRAPVDTGALRASIGNRMVSDLVAEVFAGAEYAPYVEYGTARAHAQPYLTPAVEAARPGFAAAMRHVLS